MNDEKKFIEEIDQSTENAIYLGLDLHFYMNPDRPESNFIEGLRSIVALGTRKKYLVMGNPLKARSSGTGKRNADY